MKLVDLKEMTIRAGSHEARLAQAVEQFADMNTTAEHVGDIEQFTVYKRQRGDLTDYAIFRHDQLASYGVTIPHKQELSITYTLPEFRKRGVFLAFLHFLLRHEGYNRIVLSDNHSEDTVRAIQRVYRRFDTFWERGSERAPYSPDTIDTFYGIGKRTGWKLVLENDGDWSNFPRYAYRNPDGSLNGQSDLLGECYFGFVDPEE